MNSKTAKIIEAVKTPLGLLALVVLMSEGLLLFLMKSATGADLTILTVGCVLLPFACLIALYFLYRKPNEEVGTLAVKQEVKPPSGTNYDLFVSTPMAAFATDREFEASRNAIFDVVRGIKKSCKFKSIFYAGNEIESKRDFESEDLSVVEDFDACFRSTYFMLIYPQKIATSALIELGWAMALKKPIIIFAKRRDDLPFLAKNADAVFSNLRIYEYKTSSDITNRFFANGAQVFAQLAESAAKKS